MIDLTNEELILLSQLVSKGSFSNLKHKCHLKLLVEIKGRVNYGYKLKLESASKEIFFYYINYNDEYKFKTLGMLTSKNKDTFGCAEYEFDDCHYVNLNVRKCDVLNTAFLDSLKLVKKREDERQLRMTEIKKLSVPEF